VLTLHRVRQGFIAERTAVIDRLRGLFSEFGVTVLQGAVRVRHRLHSLTEQLPGLAARALNDLRTHLRVLDERVAEYDRELKRLAKADADACRLQTIPGIRPVTASPIVASVGHANKFRNGRQFAAWLGLTPRQWSSGGKTRLGRITKRGDAYLRTLLVLGARALLRRAAARTDRLSRWALAVRARRGYHRALTAIAAKNARILWVVLAHGERFRPLQA
jgi:transposase